MCRDEVGSLRATAALLGASESIEPPPALRDAVLAAAAATRQDRPAPRAGRRATHRLERMLPAAAAVLLVGTLGLGGALAVNSQRLDEARTQASQLEETLDRLTVESSVDVPTGGQVRMVRGDGAAVVQLVDVTPPASGRTYQLWLVPAAGAPAPAGLLTDGNASAYVDALGDASAVAVTEEPAGGSDQPSNEPFAILALDTAL